LDEVPSPASDDATDNNKYKATAADDSYESYPRDNFGGVPKKTLAPSWFSLAFAAFLVAFVSVVLYAGSAMVGFVVGVVVCVVVREYLVSALFVPAKAPKPSALPDYSAMPPLTIEDEAYPSVAGKLGITGKVDLDSGVPEERPPPLYQVMIDL
jgi:hypothetical protein